MNNVVLTQVYQKRVLILINHYAKKVERDKIDQTLKELRDAGATISNVSCSNEGFLVIYRIEESSNVN